jgi:hypothetical protein
MENQFENKENENQDMLRTVNCSNLQKNNLNYLWMASHVKNQDMLSKNHLGYVKNEKRNRITPKPVPLPN